MSDKPYLFDKYIQQIVRQNSEQMKKMLEPLVKLQNPPVIKELQKSVEILSKATEGIVLKNQEAFRRLADLHIQTGLKAFSDQMELMSKQIQVNFDDLITPQISKVLANINYQTISNEDFSDYLANDFIPRVYEDLENKAEKLDKGYSSKQSLYFKLNILMFLFTVLLSLWLDRSNKNIQANNQQDHKKTHYLIEELKTKTDSLEEEIKCDSSVLLLAKKSAPVRKAPNSDSDTLITVFEGQYLDLKDEIKRWYQVQYFNFKEDRLGTGWIYKGHVEEIRGEE